MVVSRSAPGVVVACAVAVLVVGAFSVPGQASDRTRSVTEFGAVGDGRRDDSAALQRAIDALRPGGTLTFPRGTYRHDDVLTISTPGVTLTGRGARLLAGDESRSAVQIAADDVTVADLAFDVASTTRRWEAGEQHKIRIAGHDGVRLQRVRVLGSAASGVFVDGAASRFVLDHVTVSGTRADGIHMTDGANRGLLVRPTVVGSGDDGIAVVSYGRDRAPVRGIRVVEPLVERNSHGRGLSVVGGEDVTFTDILVRGSNAAAVYVAVEGSPYHTRPSRGVRVEGGRLIGSNRNPEIDHGAILVFSARPSYAVTNVLVSNLRISGTRQSASRQISVLGEGGGVGGVVFEDVSIAGGPGRAFGTNVGATQYRLRGVEHDGQVVTR